MVWPFSRAAPHASEEEKQRAWSRCGFMAAGLLNCKRANAVDPRVCEGLEAQVLHCYSGAVAPEAADAFQRCFMQAVALERYTPGACQAEVEAMRAALRRLGISLDEEAKARRKAIR